MSVDRIREHASEKEVTCSVDNGAYKAGCCRAGGRDEPKAARCRCLQC